MTCSFYIFLIPFIILDPLTSAILNANIASIIRQVSIAAQCMIDCSQASKKELPNGKVPHLCAQVKSIVTSTKSATALLQDPSGIYLTLLCVFVIR